MLKWIVWNRTVYKYKNIWHQINYNCWYATKTNQTKPLPISNTDVINLFYSFGLVPYKSYLSKCQGILKANCIDIALVKFLPVSCHISPRKQNKIEINEASSLPLIPVSLTEIINMSESFVWNHFHFIIFVHLSEHERNKKIKKYIIFLVIIKFERISLSANKKQRIEIRRVTTIERVKKRRIMHCFCEIRR